MRPSVSVRLLLSQSDERLVGYARAGHERAFEALVQRYRRQLLAYCRRLLLSEQRAEDALQQALLQAWVALRDGAEVRDARAWLYRIVHNAAVNALRVSRYDYCQLSESLSGAGAPQEDLDRRIAVREALAGLAALPEMQREALLRTAVEGRSHQQVAADLGLSEPALRGLVYRARASLRAAAAAIVPPPLIGWALDASTGGTPVLEQVAGIGAGGSAGLAGLLLKGGAVAVTAGTLAGGIVATQARHHPVTHPRQQSAGHGRTTTTQEGTTATAQAVAYTRPHTNGPPLPRAAFDNRTPNAGAHRSNRGRKHMKTPQTAYEQASTDSSPASIPSWYSPSRGRGRSHDRRDTLGSASDRDVESSGGQGRPGGGAGRHERGDGSRRHGSHEPSHDHSGRSGDGDNSTRGARIRAHKSRSGANGSGDRHGKDSSDSLDAGERHGDSGASDGSHEDRPATTGSRQPD